MKIFKFTLMLTIAMFLTACIGIMSPSEKVNNMMQKYIKNDKQILNELNQYMNEQDLTDSEKERYASIIRDEYSTIKYTIVSETIEENTATVEVYITVKDLFGASDKAERYLLENPTYFYTDDEYDKSKFIAYKLSLMESYEETRDYTIYINLYKDGDIWKISDLDQETLEKIHGIYNYNV